MIIYNKKKYTCVFYISTFSWVSIKLVSTESLKFQNFLIEPLPVRFFGYLCDLHYNLLKYCHIVTW